MDLFIIASIFVVFTIILVLLIALRNSITLNREDAHTILDGKRFESSRIGGMMSKNFQLKVDGAVVGTIAFGIIADTVLSNSENHSTAIKKERYGLLGVNVKYRSGGTSCDYQPSFTMSPEFSLQSKEGKSYRVVLTNLRIGRIYTDERPVGKLWLDAFGSASGVVPSSFQPQDIALLVQVCSDIRSTNHSALVAAASVVSLLISGL